MLQHARWVTTVVNEGGTLEPHKRFRMPTDIPQKGSALVRQDFGMKLAKHAETPIMRHIKVKGDSSPYDGDWVYWSARMGKHPEVNKSTATLLKQQKGKCTHCGLFFKDGDLLETDHIIPKTKGGKDTYDNLQVLHRHCHDTKTATDLAQTKEEEERVTVMMAHVKDIASRNSQRIIIGMEKAKEIAETWAGMKKKSNSAVRLQELGQEICTNRLSPNGQ